MNVIYKDTGAKSAWDGLGINMKMKRFIFIKSLAVTQIYENETDIAFADLTVTSERLDLIEFSVPISETNVIVIAKRPSLRDNNIYSIPFCMKIAGIRSPNCPTFPPLVMCRIFLQSS